MTSIPAPTSELAGVTVCYTPLVHRTREFVRAHCDDLTYNHVIRSWLYGTLLTPVLVKADDPFDHEAFAVAAILHDLGWALNDNTLVSQDKRFEVDGAIAARKFLAREAPGWEWDKHRVQLVWDAIALHTTPSIALHKEPEVAVTSSGITTDFLGPDMIPGGITWEQFNRIATQFPRAGLKNGVIDIMCKLCQMKPETTYDNFVGEFGAKYVSGYSREGRQTSDRLEATVESGPV